MSDPFSPYDRLALSTDGRLDRHAAAAAVEHGAALHDGRAPDDERRSPVPAPRRKPRVRVKAWHPDTPVMAMAASLIEGAERLGAVGARWLREHGFADSLIDAYGNAAVAEAARRRPDLTA